MAMTELHALCGWMIGVKMRGDSVVWTIVGVLAILALLVWLINAL